MRGKRTYIPRPILTGPKPTTASERTVRQQVADYLERIRHTLAFPCSFEDTYFGCVPAAVKHLFEMDVRQPGRGSNLLSTMFATTERTVRPNILNVSVESEEQFLSAQHGGCGYERIFWFEAPGNVPVPRNSVQTPFFLPADHPFHDAIKEWVKQASAIEDELRTSLDLIDRYTALAKTATQIKNTWPELLNFVHVGQHTALSNQVSKELCEKAAKVLRPTDKEALTYQLARAVMLPENPPSLQAWIGFYTHGK